MRSINKYAGAAVTRGMLAWFVRSTAWGMALAAVLVVGAWMRFGSASAALAYIRGDQIALEPRSIDLGSAKEGEKRDVVFTVTNLGEEPINLLGGMSTCTCAVLDKDIRATIEPLGHHSVGARIAFRSDPGPDFVRLVEIYTDEPSTPVLYAEIRGHVR